MPVVTAYCWRPMSTMPSDCLALSPASWVVSIGGRICRTGNTREESILDKGSEATQALAGQLASFVPPSGVWYQPACWQVTQPISKPGSRAGLSALPPTSSELLGSDFTSLSLFSCL